MHACTPPGKSDSANNSRSGKFKCEHLGCGWVFGNKCGREINHGKCKHRDTFEVEKILDHCVKVLPVGLGKATFLTKWAGYDQTENLWMPFANFNGTSVKDYLQTNGLYARLSMEIPLPEM